MRCEQVREYTRRITELKQKKELLVSRVVELSKNRQEYQVLISFLGIGEATAVRMIGETGDIRRFKNHKQLNTYLDIDIMLYQSGSIYYKDKINKRGPNKLRKILFYMIQTMIKLRRLGRNHFVEYYDKLKK